MRCRSVFRLPRPVHAKLFRFSSSLPLLVADRKSIIHRPTHSRNFFRIFRFSSHTLFLRQEFSTRSRQPCLFFFLLIFHPRRHCSIFLRSPLFVPFSAKLPKTAFRIWEKFLHQTRSQHSAIKRLTPTEPFFLRKISELRPVRQTKVKWKIALIPSLLWAPVDRKNIQWINPKSRNSRLNFSRTCHSIPPKNYFSLHFSNVKKFFSSRFAGLMAIKFSSEFSLRVALEALNRFAQFNYMSMKLAIHYKLTNNLID